VSQLSSTTGHPERRVRIFNDGSFARGGRFYCGLQNWPKAPVKLRSHVTIDGDATAELDFEALHVQMLYAREGVRYRGDPYDVDGFPRDVIKLASLVAINAAARPQAIGALRNEGVAQAEEALAAFERRHRRLRGYLNSEVGKELQYEDSRIAERVMLAALAADEGIIPVHDSFIVRASFEGTLRRAMVAAFEEEYGVAPVIRKK
jgi:hypothetical protein